MLACIVGGLDEVSAGVGTDLFDNKSPGNIRSMPLSGRSLYSQKCFDRYRSGTKIVESTFPMTRGHPVLILCSMHDQVVSAAATPEARDWRDPLLKEIMGEDEIGDPLSHRRHPRAVVHGQCH